MARKNPTHRSKEQWQVILDQWQSSGISVRQFCQDKSIPVSNFYNWRKRLITPQASSPANAAMPGPSFIDLSALAKSPDSGHWDITLRLGNGVELQLSQG